MPEPIRVMLQMRPTSALATSSFGKIASSPVHLEMSRFPGFQLDTSYSPVPIPPSAIVTNKDMNILESSSNLGTPSYIVRATVGSANLEEFIGVANSNPDVIGVFADPVIQPIASVCPMGPVGTDKDIEQLLAIKELKRLGMDGSGVKVVIVDTGVNIPYLQRKGKRPHFDKTLSWGPQSNQPLGNMPVDHGTMCAFDVCIAAPSCTLIDHAVLTSSTQGGSEMDGLLSDAVASYAVLLSYMTKAPAPFAGDHVPRSLVVNNSWGMFQPSWDFPVGDPQNYSHNPLHPFNIIVSSLEAAGADILFAAGNCGPECPDSRCGDIANGGIYGANSSPDVICVGGVMIDKQRIGYSTLGPGHLENNKPDITCYTHFAGSGVYSADGGTSAATPVAAGVVAAIRRIYPSGMLSPAQLRELLRKTAETNGNGEFNYEYGYGILNVIEVLNELNQLFPKPNMIKTRPVA